MSATYFYTVILKIRGKNFNESYRYHIDIEAESEEEARIKVEKMWEKSHADERLHICYIDVSRYSDSDIITYHQFTKLE